MSPYICLSSRLVAPWQRPARTLAGGHAPFWAKKKGGSLNVLKRRKRNGGLTRKRISPPLPKIQLCASPHWGPALPSRHTKCKVQQPDSRTACVITVATQPGMLPLCPVRPDGGRGMVGASPRPEGKGRWRSCQETHTRRRNAWWDRRFGGGRERSRPILSLGPYLRRFVRDEKKEHFPRVSHTCR